MRYTEEQIFKILSEHKVWLNNCLEGRPADFNWANLQGINLGNVDLRCANLAQANLRGTDLRGANLAQANLAQANLRGTDLRGANLHGTDLSGANLSWSCLTRADLTRANLLGANLQGANLSGAKLIVLALPHYTAYVQDTHTRVGCQYHANDAWRGFSDESIADMDSKALEFWHAYKSVIFAAMDAIN